jgi:RND family efflux transporter MFP subunit
MSIERPDPTDSTHPQTPPKTAGQIASPMEPASGGVPHLFRSGVLPGPPPMEPASGGVPHHVEPMKDSRRLGGRIFGLFRRFDWRIAAILVLVLVALAVWLAVAPHGKPKEEAATPLPVAVAKVTREDLFNQVTMPAEFRPYLQVELHAKVSGYVDQINVDIGDQVKAGQLLAKLEVPELQAELDHASAQEKLAEADYKDAHLIYNRLVAVNKEHPNLVAQQDLDTAESKDHTTEAAIAGAKADVEKYQTLVGYTRITAPFDGVITWRYADPGSLIQAGTASDTQSLPLVRVSDNYHLRLDFPVSVAYVKDIRINDPVEVRVQSVGGKSFTGTISRCTQKVNEDTRTMITEIEVPNPKLELVPGMYAEVDLKVGRRLATLSVPIEAVSADKQATVYLVNRDGEIEVRPVTLGLETSDKYEILTGLGEGDMVMVGSRAQVKPGQKVEPKVVGSLARE